MVETALIQSLNNGSKNAFDQLYFQYHKIVFANIFKFVKKQEEAEELLQDVFVALWENRKKINPQQSLLGWLTIVSHNKAINHLNRSVKNVLVQNGIMPIEIADLPEVSDAQFEFQLKALEDAISQLPPRKRDAFLLCKMQGKSYEEAASILGISTNTVKEHIKGASKFLKAYITLHHPTAALSMLSFTYFLQQLD